MKTFDSIKMIPDLLAYKIFPLEHSTLAERRARQNAKSSVLRYLKESLNLFLYLNHLCSKLVQKNSLVQLSDHIFLSKFF